MVAALPMTGSRRAILAVGVPLVLIVVGLATEGWVEGSVNYLASQAQVGYAVRLSVPPTDGHIRVTSSNGNLTLRGGTGPRIVVRGHLSSSFHRPAFSYRSSPAGLNLNPQCRVPIGSCSLNFSVTAPAALSTSVSDSFGNLDASDLRGTVALWENSGNLTASRLTGHVRLEDSFGEITASRLTGSILLDNNSGDIQAAGVVGDTRLQDSFGEITVTGLAAADVVASNNSGDISLTFTKVPQRVNITDSFGNITLILPPGPATYRVNAHTSFGSRTVSVPQSPSARNVITASNNSGNITIVTRKHPAPPVAPSGPAGP